GHDVDGEGGQRQPDDDPHDVDGEPAALPGRHRRAGGEIGVEAAGRERFGAHGVRVSSATAVTSTATASKTARGPWVVMCSWKAATPMTAATSGSVIVSTGSDACSGPAWKALCDARTPKAASAARA